MATRRPAESGGAMVRSWTVWQFSGAEKADGRVVATNCSGAQNQPPPGVAWSGCMLVMLRHSQGRVLDQSGTLCEGNACAVRSRAWSNCLENGTSG